MINVITPFNREQNLDLLAKVLKNKCKWTVLIDRDIKFPDWVEVRRYDKAPAGVCPSNWLFNKFIDEGLDDETQYMILCDDDSVEEGFFDNFPNSGIVITSMKRGQRVPVNGVGYGHGDLTAHPDNIQIGKIGGEQFIVKGKVLKNYRYGLSSVGDGEMIIDIMKTHTAKYRPDKYVLFNYFEDGRYDSFRRKPFYIIVSDLYKGNRPQYGLDEWTKDLFSSLLTSGIAEGACFFYDEFFYKENQRADEKFIEIVNQIKPDAVIFKLYKAPSSTDVCVPLIRTFEILKHQGIRMVGVWGDLSSIEERWLAKSLMPYLSINYGTNSEYTNKITDPSFKFIHYPKNTAVFNDDGIKRTKDVSFTGSTIGRKNRLDAIEFLMNNGIDITVLGFNAGSPLSDIEYARTFKESKMALSFSVAEGLNVINARSWEVMLCGALLLEQENKELEKFFTPDIDYVSWKDHDELLQKIQYYLSHEDERVKIAKSGFSKVHKLYTGKTFWKIINNDIKHG